MTFYRFCFEKLVRERVFSFQFDTSKARNMIPAFRCRMVCGESWTISRRKGFEKEVVEKFAGKLPLRGSTKC